MTSNLSQGHCLKFAVSHDDDDDDDDDANDDDDDDDGGQWKTHNLHMTNVEVTHENER